MRVNRHNLEIAKHCATKPASGGQRIDLFHFTDTGTMVIAEGAVYAISVSALSRDQADSPASVLPDTYEGASGDNYFYPIGRACIPQLPAPTGEPIHEITIDARYLKGLAEAAIEFEGTKNAVRIRFYGEDKPISLNLINSETGQKWEAMLMPRYPEMDEELFNRCGVTSEGAQSQCILQQGHPEKLHKMGELDEEFLPLCEDEGCPQFGTDHACVTQVETEIERAMRLAAEMMKGGEG